VERWFAELISKWLKRGTHRSVAELTGSIQAWIDTWNQNPRPFVWTKTADQILETSPDISNKSPTQDTSSLRAMLPAPWNGVRIGRRIGPRVAWRCAQLRRSPL
jgi:hypothetical protein